MDSKDLDRNPRTELFIVPPFFERSNMLGQITQAAQKKQIRECTLESKSHKEIEQTLYKVKRAPTQSKKMLSFEESLRCVNISKSPNNAQQIFSDGQLMEYGEISADDIVEVYL